MAYFVVLGSYGTARVVGLELHDQSGWCEHAAFMDALADAGTVLFAGPFGDGDRVLIVAQAESAAALSRLLAADPWRASGVLLPPDIEPWDVRIGDLSPARPQGVTAGR